VVNILTNHAFHNREIKVFGGEQLRPNVHIDDMVDSYLAVLNAEPKKINKEIFNVGFRNQSVNELADDVKNIIGDDIKIINTKSDDNRSYHVSSKKIKDLLGFETKYTVKDAVLDLKIAFEKKLLTNTFDNEFFYNIKRMNSIKLQ
jgi:nucleoside-diphosphate-sugar epimerase